MVAGISPCILPVLPIILVAGVTTPVKKTTSAAPVVATVGATTAGSVVALATNTAADGPTDEAPETEMGPAPNRYRAYAIIAGLVLSFSIFTLAGSALLSALGLPQDFLRDAGLVVLGLVALGLMI